MGIPIAVRHPGHDQGEMLLDPLGDEPGLETSSDAVDENQKLTTDFAPQRGASVPIGRAKTSPAHNSAPASSTR